MYCNLFCSRLRIINDNIMNFEYKTQETNALFWANTTSPFFSFSLSLWEMLSVMNSTKRIALLSQFWILWLCVDDYDYDDDDDDCDWEETNTFDTVIQCMWVCVCVRVSNVFDCVYFLLLLFCLLLKVNPSEENARWWKGERRYIYRMVSLGGN